MWVAAAAARSAGADQRQEQPAEATEDSDRRIPPPRTALCLSSVSTVSANTRPALGKTPLVNPEYPIEASGWYVRGDRDLQVGRSPGSKALEALSRNVQPKAASTALFLRRHCAVRAGGTFCFFIQMDYKGRGQGRGKVID